MDGGNRYERAFIAWLRYHQLSYLPVDESQRRAVQGQAVKNPDLLAYDRCGRGYVVEVKGRRFPGGSRDKPRRVWERWCTRQDCSSLLAWGRLLHVQSLLVFVYHLRQEPAQAWPNNWSDTWTWQGDTFALCGILAESYIQHMRLRSPRWDTVSLSSEVFRTLAQPVSVIFGLRGSDEQVSTGSIPNGTGGTFSGSAAASA